MLPNTIYWVIYESLSLDCIWTVSFNKLVTMFLISCFFFFFLNLSIQATATVVFLIFFTISQLSNSWYLTDVIPSVVLSFLGLCSCVCIAEGNQEKFYEQYRNGLGNTSDGLYWPSSLYVKPLAQLHCNKYKWATDDMTMWHIYWLRLLYKLQISISTLLGCSRAFKTVMEVTFTLTSALM